MKLSSSHRSHGSNIPARNKIYRKKPASKGIYENGSHKLDVYHLQRLFSCRMLNGNSGHKDAKVARPYALGHASETLLATNRIERHSLGPPVYLLSRQTSSAGDGRKGGTAVS